MTKPGSGIFYSFDDELFYGAAFEQEAACTVSPVDTHQLPRGGYYFAPGVIEPYRRTKKHSKWALRVLAAVVVIALALCFLAAAAYGVGHAWFRLL